MAVAPVQVEAVLLSAPLVALALAGPQLGARQAALASAGAVVLAVEMAWRRAVRIRCQRPRPIVELRAALLPPALAAVGAALLAVAGPAAPAPYDIGLSSGAVVSMGIVACFLIPWLPTPTGRLFGDIRSGEGLSAGGGPTIAELADPPRPHPRGTVDVDGGAAPDDVRQLLTFTPAVRVTVGDLVVGTVTERTLDPPADDPPDEALVSSSTDGAPPH